METEETRREHFEKLKLAAQASITKAFKDGELGSLIGIVGRDWREEEQYGRL